MGRTTQLRHPKDRIWRSPMREPFLDDINRELTKLRERQIIQPARPRRPDWFWPALLASALCVGFGAGETWIAFTGSGSIITGLLLAAIGLFVLSECWPWMKGQQQ